MKRSIMIATIVVGASAIVRAQPAADPVEPVTAAPTPAVTPAPPVLVAEPATKASSDDIDLSSLGLDPTAASFDDKLNIFGFADFSFSGLHFQTDPKITTQTSSTFVLGHLNLYLSKNLTPKARSLVEVQFTFLPNGSRNADGTFINTTVNDPTDASRPVQWGGIIIERAYVEYDLTDHLTLRAGHWLTPYGIWNIDHGSPVILGTSRPYIIGEQFFPEHQTGLDLFGSHEEGELKFNYHATATNGRGDAEAQSDQDSQLAFGGRLEVEARGLRLGGSYYRGRFTGLPKLVGTPPTTYREVAYGADAQFDRGGFHFQAELIIRERHFEDGHRESIAAGFTADGRDSGGYALVGYRFTRLWNVMPYANVQQESPSDHTVFSRVLGGEVGLNFRPTANLVLKLSGTIGSFTAGAQLPNGNIYLYASQVAWVF